MLTTMTELQQAVYMAMNVSGLYQYSTITMVCSSKTGVRYNDLLVSRVRFLSVSLYVIGENKCLVQ